MATAAPEAATASATDSRAIQLALSAQLVRDVARLWPNLDRKRLDATFPSWLQLMMTLVDQYHGMASLAASIFYRDARQEATGVLTPDGVVKLAAPPSGDWMARAFGYSGPGILRDGAYQDSTALSMTQGTAVRIAQSGARDTILSSVQADPKAVGWYRVTDGSPCAFCALMASRGVVYGSERTASFKSHNDCGCTAAPAFSRNHALPDISHTALRVYRDSTAGLPNRDRIAAFRKAWNAHLDATQPAQAA